MRSIKLAAAIAAAVLLPALSSTAASARQLSHRHDSSPGRCQIDLFAEPHAITSGETVEVFGRLQCRGSSDEGQTVTVYSNPAGPLPTGSRRALGVGATALGSATTGAGGYYSFVQHDVTSDSYFSAAALGVRSSRRAVKVAPVVTLSGPSEALPLFTGFRNRATFTGTVSPADVGARVVLQREDATSSEEWHVIGLGVVGAGGAYTLVHRFVRPGDANLRVVVRRHEGFRLRGISNTISYGISQKENPALTIHTTAYSIPYGSPVTLSGNVAAGSGRPVTLQARPRGGVFSTVAGATTGAGGQYQFVQTPLQNTVYRVFAGALHSAALFEGVKYVLTAGVSATTVPSGQPLTFSGTLAPANKEKAVYLERENSTGGGYHVFDTTKVSSAGTYSLTDFIFGSGKAVFRVKVSGDPANQQVSSAPFTIEVTPAPPSLLKPVVQPKQPLEGQL